MVVVMVLWLARASFIDLAMEARWQVQEMQGRAIENGEANSHTNTDSERESERRSTMAAPRRPWVSRRGRRSRQKSARRLRTSRRSPHPVGDRIGAGEHCMPIVRGRLTRSTARPVFLTCWVYRVNRRVLFFVFFCYFRVLSS